MGSFLIIDEISMLEGQCLTTINTRLNSLKGERGHDMLFGGKNIIFMGDFMQLPTISGNETYMSRFWALNAAIVLTEQIRQADDPQFAGILRRLRLRQPTDEDIEVLKTKIRKPSSQKPQKSQ